MAFGSLADHRWNRWSDMDLILHLLFFESPSATIKVDHDDKNSGERSA